jgi:integrase
MTTASRVPTLAAVLLGILADESLSASRRNGIASALRSFAKWTSMTLEAIPAHPRYLRERMARISFAAAGVSKHRLVNVRSLLGTALEHAGVNRIPGRYRVPLAPAWEDMIKLLPNAMSRFRLSRFAHDCSALGIAPEAVDNATFDAFVRHLDAADLKDSPRDLARTARQFWNKAVDTIPGWPQRHVMVPDYTNGYALPWDTFPLSLRAEVDTWFARLASTDPLDELPFRPLRPSTIATRRRQLHEYVSALAHSGHPPETLCSLADLVQVDWLKDALRFIIARKQAAEHPAEPDIGGGTAAMCGANTPAPAKLSVQALHLAQMISAIARHHVKVPIEHQNRLKAICKQLSPEHLGLSERNSDRLRQFDDPTLVQRMITLPRRIIAGLRRSGTPTRRDALRAQDAVALEILLMVPMRLANLVSLELGRHLLTHRGGGMRLHIPAREVKNSAEINAPLPAESVCLITEYLERYRPLLADPAMPFLFPGKGGKAKGTDMMRAQIKRVTAEDGAVDVTPHFARHFAAKHFLTKNPGQYGVVRLVLGHKSVNTTTQYYADTDSTHANGIFVAHVTQMRGPDEGNQVGKPKPKPKLDPDPDPELGTETAKRKAATKSSTRKEK